MQRKEAAASDEHQTLVKALIDHFKSKKFGITCAAYEDYKECDKTGRHEPDVRAYDSTNELVYIGEVKTCDDLTSQTTKEEFEDFSNRIMTR